MLKVAAETSFTAFSIFFGHLVVYGLRTLLCRCRCLRVILLKAVILLKNDCIKYRTFRFKVSFLLPCDTSMLLPY
jgi:hypothetical protein